MKLVEEVCYYYVDWCVVLLLSLNYDENLSLCTKQQVHFLIHRDIPVFLEIY